MPCMLCTGKWLRRDSVVNGSAEEACGAHSEQELRAFRAQREEELAVAMREKLVEKKELAKRPAGRRGRFQKKPAAGSARGKPAGVQKKPAGVQKKPAGVQKKPAGR